MDSLPFYALPEDLKTSAEIISEARTCIRSIETRRPFTPRESNRQLFGQIGNSKWARPPSAFSAELRGYNFSDVLKRNRLEPLDRVPKSAPSCLAMDSPIAETRPKFLKSATCPDLSKILKDVSKDQDTAKVEKTFYGSVVQGLNGAADKHGAVFTSWLLDSKKKQKEVGVELTGKVDNSTVPQLPGICGLDELTSDSSYKRKIVPLLEKLVNGEESDRKLVVVDLYENLEECNLFSSRNAKYRPAILKTLFKLLGSDDTDFLLQLLRIILAMKVTGNNLIKICKLLFKITRNDGNDLLFLNNNFLELFLKAIQSMDFIEDSEALVYSVGSLKFLSIDVTVLRQLSSFGCIDILTIHIHRINSYKRCNGEIPDQTLHVLFQLTGCVRNLAESSSNRWDFVAVGTVLELWHTLDLFPDDVDIVMNVARTLSKLTTYADVSLAIATQPNCHLPFLHLLKKYENRHDLVVRLCYILGNLTARDDQTRIGLHQTSTNTNVFLHLLESFHRKYTGPESDSCGEKSELTSKIAAEAEDILIKIIRILGNMCINANVGQQLALNNQYIGFLLSILVSRQVDLHEELILTTVAALNNLSYYLESDGTIVHNQVLIAEHLLQMLTTKHTDGVVETLRVLGNLSRSRAVRVILARSRAVEMMVHMLDESNRDVVFLAAGVLVNLMADEENRPILFQEGGITKFVKVLQCRGAEDWHLASVVCQAIWNYCCKMAVTFKTFGSRETVEMLTFLEQYLDESNVAITEGEYEDMLMEEVQHDVWEKEFCPVAARILDKIESCM